MLVISPSEVAAAIGASCGDSDVADLDKSVVRILRLITPRLEGALNVASLTRGAFSDYFYLSCMGTGTCEPSLSQLRLSNGFIVPGSISVYDPDNEVVLTSTDADSATDLDHGIVNLSSWRRGMYRVGYTSGFEPDAAPTTPPDWFEDGDRVLKDIPDWMKGIAVNLMILWYRTALLAPKHTKEISYVAVDAALRRELYARVYERYMRPRVGVVFSDRMSYG